ncbi:MAG TPA: M14 family zinc carboxypeptidase [Candidatus Nitrosocosmicus sp.]
MKINSILDEVDNYSEFLTINEIEDELKKIQRNQLIPITAIGKSLTGRYILSAKIGDGEKNALVFGFPHPNEPIGSLTCLSLIKAIYENEYLKKRFTWYIVPCADPDGALLNEGWFKGKFTIEKYVKNFYRSKDSLQTDWTFPLNYKDYVFNESPSNVVALAKLIENVKPELVYPIHNSSISGAYFFMTRYFGENFYDELMILCKNLSIPLDMGEPELAFMKEWNKPVYREFTGKDYYDYYTDVDIESSRRIGDSSIGYSKNFNQDAIGIIGEIPYIYDNKIEDNSLTKKTRRENIVNEIKDSEKLKDFIFNVMGTAELNKKSIFYDLFLSIMSSWEKELLTKKRYLQKKIYEELATVSQEFSNIVAPYLRQSLLLGELRRLLIESPKTKQNAKLLKDIEEEIVKKIKFIKQHSEIKTFSIKNLIQLQLGFLLLCLRYM